MNTEVLLPTAVIVIMTLVYFYVRKSGRYNKNLPIITAKAYIIKKRVERWSGGTNAPTIIEYYIDVDIEGIKHEIKVPSFENFENLVPNARGILLYQKNRLNNIFVNFIPEVNK